MKATKVKANKMKTTKSNIRPEITFQVYIGQSGPYTVQATYRADAIKKAFDLAKQVWGYEPDVQVDVYKDGKLFTMTDEQIVIVSECGDHLTAKIGSLESELAIGIIEDRPFRAVFDDVHKTGSSQDWRVACAVQHPTTGRSVIGWKHIDLIDENEALRFRPTDTVVLDDMKTAHPSVRFVSRHALLSEQLLRTTEALTGMKQCLADLRAAAHPATQAGLEAMIAEVR